MGSDVHCTHLKHYRKCLITAKSRDSGFHHLPLVGANPASGRSEAVARQGQGRRPAAPAFGTGTEPQGSRALRGESRARHARRPHRPAPGKRRAPNRSRSPCADLQAAGAGLAGAGAPGARYSSAQRTCGSRRCRRRTIYTALTHVLPCCIIHAFLAEDKNFITANVQVFINVETARQTWGLEEALEKEPKPALCKQIFLKAAAW